MTSRWQHGSNGFENERLRMPVPFNKPHVFPEGLAAIQDSCANGKLSGDGLHTKRCSQWFNDKFGYSRCLLTPSCTAALEMAALLLDLGRGDEVICPSYTFVSTANAFALRGCKIVFADSESATPNVSVEDILAKVTPRTKAICVVHYAGIAVDVQKIKDATHHKIPIVEDCAHAIGSIDPVTNQVVGKNCDFAAFSFHETKNICIGEGGLLVINDESKWKQAQIIREKGTNRVDFREGRAAFYTWIGLGSSYLLSEVDAGILWGALLHYDETQNKRLAVWDTYNKTLHANSLFRKPDPKHARANAHMYYLEFHDPQVLTEFSKVMKDSGILVATHYLPLDTSPYMKAQDAVSAAPCTHAALWSKALVRLPVFFTLTEEMQGAVVSVANSFCSSHGLVLVPATEFHWEAIRAMRNKDREAFWHTDEIDKETHWRFMAIHTMTYRVALDKGECVGFIGHVGMDARLGCTQKGHGVAEFMWRAFSLEFPNLDVKVKRGNERSLGFFKKMGYAPVPTAMNAGEDPLPLALLV
jgi:dTDP-4-amino-4,6-dideoxygalactose transaminase